MNVAGAQGEIGFPLTLGSEVFEKSEPSSLVQLALDYLKGRKVFPFFHLLRFSVWSMLKKIFVYRCLG